MKSKHTRRNRIIKPVIVAILAIGLAFLSPSSALSADTGDPAPLFRLKNTNDDDVSLENYKGKVVFVNFWGTWCSPCREEFPELDILYRKLQKEGFEVVAVSVDKSASRVRAFIEKIPVSFAVLIDTEGSTADAYDVTGMPMGYLIDKEGVIRKRYFGFSKESPAIYEKDIIELLK